MKQKILSTMLVVVLALGAMTGCGSSASSTADTPAKEDSAENEENGEASEAGTEAKKVVIGYVDSGAAFLNEALAVAIDTGILEEELSAVGYTFEAVPFTGAGPAINEAFVNGSIDIATTGDVPAINGKASGVETTLLAAELQFNDAAVVVQASSDVETIADLKGKVVGTLQGSYMHKTLINMLEANGLSFSDIQFTNMTSADAAAAVAEGAIDAACVANTQEAALVDSDDVRIILNCDDNKEWKGGHALVIRTDYLAENREAAVAFVKAMKRANEYATNNYDEAIEILSKSGAPAEAFKFYFPEQVNFNVSGGDDVVKAYESIKGFLSENQLLTADFDISEWIDTSIWDDAVTE